MEKVKDRTGIYHEHQQGFLCGQHALNNLLQNPFFTPDILADIARDLDVEEISVLEHTPLESENVDDTGFFNIQVLERALKTFEIELISYASQKHIAQQARASPESVQAYLCNLGHHWFTIRQFGRQYFNLNSFYYVPEFISEMMLAGCLSFIQEKGCALFIVHGTLPACLADQQLTDNPISLTEYRFLTKDLPKIIMNENLLGQTKGGDESGSLVVNIPYSLYNEFQRNPNDPDIRRRFNSYLPNGVTVDDITGFSDMPKDTTSEEIIASRNYSCHHPEVSTDSHVHKPHKRQEQSHIITQHMAEYMVEKPNLNNRNETHRDQLRTSQSVDEFQNAETELLQHVIARSLLHTKGTNDDNNYFLREDPTEKLNQRLLDQAIAASLITNGAAINQPEDIPEFISSSSVVSSESKSSINAHSSQPTTTTTDSFSATDAQSQPPNDVHSTKSTVTCSPQSETIHSVTSPNHRPTMSADTYSSQPRTTYAPPSPTVVDSDGVKPLSIEELRQRRLQNYGNRDRSIILQVSNFND